MNDLRDLYAAFAMHALLKAALDANIPRENVAKMAFKIADTMLKVREE